MSEQSNDSSKAERIAKLNEQIAQLKEEQSEQDVQIKQVQRQMKIADNIGPVGNPMFVLTGIIAVVVLSLYDTDMYHWVMLALAIFLLVLGVTFKVLGLVLTAKLERDYGSWGGARRTVQDLEEEKSKLARKQARCEREIDLLEGKPDALKVYRGKDWNMRVFKPTQANIKDLELDIENLFISMQYARGSAEQANNWMCNSRKRRYKAILKGKTDKQKEYDDIFLVLAKTGSWKIRVAQVVMLTLDLALMDPDFSMSRVEIFEEIYEKANVPAAETPEQKEFYKSAMIAAMLMGGALQTLKNMDLL